MDLRAFDEVFGFGRGRIVAGVDEAGRGPLAGPVTAAAVVLDPARIPDGLADSKTLTDARRRALAAQLEEVAVVAVAHATVEEIDRLNVLRASLLAMRRAVLALARRPEIVLVDGREIPDGLPGRAEAVIGGDGRSLSIAAASILAKVARDDIMRRLAEECPGYGWERNNGYGTREHLRALQHLGVTPHHRRSFAPVHKILCKESDTTP